VVDIGINLTNKAFRKNWKSVIRRAIDAGVQRIVLTGTSTQSSRESLRLAHEWYETEGTPNLCATVGIHPHDAKSWSDDNSNDTTLEELKELLQDPLAVAVGECGLDYNRNFSSRSDQIRAFREQVKLAHELNYPIFVHEREAHGDLLRILDEIRSPTNKIIEPPPPPPSPSRVLPKIVVHCFTGTKEEALAYIQRGYYLGFTGTICKKERGAHLRKILPSLPLEKVMIETDAPYMGFKKNQRFSEPADCVDVAKQLSESIDRPFEEVCKTTTQTAMEFFRLP
jgi:TatD DNase family protein